VPDLLRSTWVAIAIAGKTGLKAIIVSSCQGLT
jgi:hypothetical protein